MKTGDLVDRENDFLWRWAYRFRHDGFLSQFVADVGRTLEFSHVSQYANSYVGNSADVEFILKVKNATGPRRQSDDAQSVSTVDTMCTAATDTTDTTLQFSDSYEDLLDMVSHLSY